MSGGSYVTHEECSESNRQVLEKLDSIEKRLFKDNGTVSIQTRIERHEQILRVLLWSLAFQLIDWRRPTYSRLTEPEQTSRKKPQPSE